MEGVVALTGPWGTYRSVAALLWLLVALLALGVLATPVAAAGPTLITSCSNDSQLQAAAAKGGSYVFATPCSITLSKPLTIDSNFSLDGAGYRVLINGPTTGSGGRAFTIEGSVVTLTGVSFEGRIDGFGASGAQGSPGGAGGPGQPGSSLSGGAMLVEGGAQVTVSGTSVSDATPDEGTLNSAGGNGGSGGSPASGCAPGGNGGPGGEAGTVRGGAVYVSAGSSLTLENAQLDGFSSSEGGFGGDGAPSCSGAVQGDGGQGAAAGVVEGGAIYNAGTVTLDGSRVADSDADSLAGAGGNCCVSGYGGSSGGTGGADGGAGAPAGQVLGGAIYNTGTLDLDGATLDSNSAESRGGAGGSTSYVGTPGAGANAAAAEGGAIYTASSLADACATYSQNTVTSAGGQGGVNYSAGTHGQAGKNGAALGPNIEAAGSATVHSCQTAISVSDAFVREPAKGGSANANFTVSLNQEPTSPVTVDYATKDGTATVAHGDYKQTSGSLTFDPGKATEQTVAVPVYGTGLTNDARFSLVLSQPSGATIEKSVGIATIETGPLTITTKTLAVGWPDESYSATLAAIGGATPYTWTVTRGSLPDGLELDPLTGVISGTPSNDGRSTFTVEATDSATPQNTAETQLAIDIGVHITSISPPGSAPGGGGTITVTGYGFDAAPDQLAFCPSGSTSSCVAAEDVVVSSDTTLTATIPAESASIRSAGGDASVAVDQGSTHHSNLVAFTYGLHISSITPTGSAPGGGGTITVTGYGLDAAPDQLAFCPSGSTSSCVAAEDVEVSSDTTLTATIPAESAPIKSAGGDASVAVDQGGSNHSNLVAFTYGLHIDSITPTVSAPAGGGTITVSGYGFEAAPDGLAFCPRGSTSGCVAADDVEASSDTTLTATIPAESAPIKSAGGAASVAVDQGGTNHSNLVPFTYETRGATPESRPTTAPSAIAPVGRVAPIGRA